MRAQISGIRYDPSNETFFGLEIDMNTKHVTRHVTLSETWVYNNFPEIADQIKQHGYSQQKIRYFHVPLADSCDEENYKNQLCTNPKIQYRQFEHKTCAFDSLSSAFAYKRFTISKLKLYQYSRIFLLKICILIIFTI